MDKKEELLKQLKEKKKETAESKVVPQDNKQRLQEKIAAQKKLDDSLTEDIVQIPKKEILIKEKLQKAAIKDEEEAVNILDEADEQIAALQKENDELKKEISSLKNITYNDIKVIDDKANGISRKLANLILKGEEQAKSANANKSLQKQLKSKADEITSLKEDLSTLKKEVKKLTSKNEKLTQDANQYKQIQKANSNAEKDELKKTLAASIEKSKKLESEVEELTALVGTLKEEKESLMHLNTVSQNDKEETIIEEENSVVEELSEENIISDLEVIEETVNDVQVESPSLEEEKDNNLSPQIVYKTTSSTKAVVTIIILMSIIIALAACVIGLEYFKITDFFTIIIK